MAATGTPATRLLAAAGVPVTLHPFCGGSTDGGYGAQAAASLGVAPERVFKTLIAAVDGALHVAVVPVSGTLDLRALAAAVGGKRAVLAEPAVAQRSSGYVVGGISPLGQRTALPTVVDASVTDHAKVLVSAGRRGLMVELAPADLLRLTGASTAHLGRA